MIPNGTGRLVIATGAEIRLTDHTDNGVAFVDADGDIQTSAGFTFNGTDVATIGSISVSNTRLLFENNKIQTQTSNDDIDIDPKNGTGKLNIITTAQATVGSAG